MPAERGVTESGARPHVAGLVLAAGAGRRYGMPKALVPYGGSLLIERAYRVVSEICDPVLVVLGASADEVISRARLGRARVLINPDWDTGMASSLRAGLAGLAALTPAPGGFGQSRQSGGLPANRQGEPVIGSIDAVLVHLVDLPGMTAAAIRRVARYASADVLAVGTYDGVRGHPVLLGRTHWAGVAESATGDQGARAYLASHDVIEVECSDVADPADLDYPPA
ncbi:MAG: nucleotidyltransferase family protein [Actinomycetota bacterium]|nr:nucleotidyltransferase family protein [Actinomycetota bacterium]